MAIRKQTAELQERRNNITIDKRLRLTWETEVTVTVMMERAERMQRSIEEEDEGLEGRFYWIKGTPRTWSEAVMSSRRPASGVRQSTSERLRLHLLFLLSFPGE